MPISYVRLWKLLIDKKMNKTDLKEVSGISFNVIAKMGKDQPVSINILISVLFPILGGMLFMKTLTT